VSVGLCVIRPRVLIELALGGSRCARRQPPESVQHVRNNAMPVDIAYFGTNFSQISPTLPEKKKLREAGRPSQACSVGFDSLRSKIATIAN
jgi:hypothetical protein